MSTTNSKKTDEPKQSLDQLVKDYTEKIKRQPTPVLISLGMIVLSLLSVIFNLIFMIKVTTGLNMQDISPNEGQLLNRQAIENASLLLEQSVEFKGE